MQPDNLLFKLSDVGEHIVRTYECTQLRRWFSPPTMGYLTITNRRIVFHSRGTSLTGKSLLISELPLDDVSGLSVYKGQSIDWLRLIFFSLVTMVIANVILGMLPPALVNSLVAILLMLPFTVLWLLSSVMPGNTVRARILQNLNNIIHDKIGSNHDVNSLMKYTRLLLYLGLVILGYLTGWLTLLVILAFVILMVFSGTQHTFSLLVGSKTVKDSGIFIPGDRMSLLSFRDTTALQALEARPAADADQVLRDLGAMIMDIQQLGDLGVQKWKAV